MNGNVQQGILPLYTRPEPAAQWVGLTEKELYEIHDSSRERLSALCAVEAKLKEKNT